MNLKDRPLFSGGGEDNDNNINNNKKSGSGSLSGAVPDIKSNASSVSG